MAFFFLTLRSAVEFGKLGFELHRVFLFSLAKTALGIAVLLFPPRNLTETLGVRHLVIGLDCRSHSDWHGVCRKSSKEAIR